MILLLEDVTAAGRSGAASSDSFSPGQPASVVVNKNWSLA